jgi:type II secretory pathway pseudopilin PulG
MNTELKKKKAFALIEILLAIGIFVVVIGSVSLFSVDALRASENSRIRSQANGVVDEFMSAIRLKKNTAWFDILSLEEGQQYYVELVDGEYEVLEGSRTIDSVEVYFMVEPAFRNESGNVSSEGLDSDPTSKRITIFANWTDIIGNAQTLENTFYLNSWQAEVYSETLASEFNEGSFDETVVTETADGEVVLNSQAYSNWCEPALTQSVYDLPGTGIPTILSSIPGKAFMGSTSYSLQNLNVDHATDPAIVTVEAEFQGYSTNSIWGDENYTYLATTDDNKEVVIVDTVNAPYQEVGHFNGSGTTDATSVYVQDNVGYVAQGRTLRSFDLSSKIGARPQLNSINVGGLGGVFFVGYISEIEIRGDYAFLSMYDDWYELIIVNISNPSNMQVVRNVELNYSQSSDLYVSDDGNRVFIGTTVSSQYDEFFILDTTNKSGTIPILSSYDTGGMNVRGNTVIDDRAIIVGNGGMEYQVLDISNINSPTFCGGLDVPAGLNGVTSIRTDTEDVYSYIIGNAPTEEFRIIKGGIGTGGSSFAETGVFTSRIVDLGVENPVILAISWEELVSAQTDIRLQIRVSDSSDMLGSEWVGIDGTGATFFENAEGEYIPVELHGNRYIQYRVFLDSDGSATPEFAQVDLLYQ